MGTFDTFVTDPLPPPPSSGICQMRIFPNPDEVIFCAALAVYDIIAPCCQYPTPVCTDCIDKFRQCGFWQCNQCGHRTDAPAQFTARRRRAA